MQISNITTIFKKEMVDTLRDRRTLIFMMLVPLVAIPLLMMGMSKLVMKQISEAEAKVAAIVIEGAEYLPEDLMARFEESEDIDVKDIADFEGLDLNEEITAGNLQAIVKVDEGFSASIEQESITRVEIVYDKSEMPSEFAEGRIISLLEGYRDDVVERRIEGRDLSKDILKPYKILSDNIAPMQKMVGKQLGGILPYLIILMCFMGAMYPAIDLAAGEKERGTLETLLVSPATRGEFVIGKYLVILTTGIVAAFLSLGSMTYSVNYMLDDLLQGMTQMLAIEFDMQTVALVFLVILPLAGIFAGILLSLSVFARSFKEAQSYITVLNMVVILPAFMSMLPGIKVSLAMSLIPIVNVSLIMKEAVSGTIQWEYVFVAMAVNIALAIITLVFCKKWFERESVLFRM